MGLSKQSYDGGLTCALSVLDMDKAIKWYTDVLGFKLIYKMDDLAWCEMESPVAKVNVGLSQVETLEVSNGNAVLTWGVSDIEAARTELEKHDVRFDGAIQTIPEMVRLCTFFDPDGNCFMLYQDLSPA